MAALYPSTDPAELALVRFYEQERFSLTGQEATYFSLDRSENVDPLYDEPYDETTGDGWVFAEYTVTIAVEFQEESEQDAEGREEGLDIAYNAIAYVAYNEWEDNGAGPSYPPKIGDVITCMEKDFDIVKAGKEGEFVDTPTATGYKMELRVRSKFDPSRKTDE
jgi:hypothetical protein